MAAGVGGGAHVAGYRSGCDALRLGRSEELGKCVELVDVRVGSGKEGLVLNGLIEWAKKRTELMRSWVDLGRAWTPNRIGFVLLTCSGRLLMFRRGCPGVSI